MISKPLFKQSCKANAGTWVFVTAIICFMLAILILVLGNINVNGIRQSMTDMFITDAVESTIDKQSMTYYNLTEKALTNYESGKNNLTIALNLIGEENRTQLSMGYDSLIQAGYTESEAREYLTNGKSDDEKLLINTFISYYIMEGNDISENKIKDYVLTNICNEIYEQVKVTEGEESANYAKLFIVKAINDFISSSSDNAKEFATMYIPQVLKGIFYQQFFEYNGNTIYIKDYYSENEISNMSSSAIISYRAEMDVKEQQIRQELMQEEGYDSLTEEQIELEVANRLNKYSNQLIANKTGTLIEELPTEVATALQELGAMDIYSLVIGSIYFRIAGLLLPLIYIIMTANNLIASQVDTGSMAYVLSTPTKRITVSITQMVYLIASLFAMFVFTTITGLICLFIVGSGSITISYVDMLLFNLGAFITTFAISGICFLASSWFNRSKQSMAVGGGISMFFLVATILGLFGSSVMPQAIKIQAMDYFNYVSLISLYDTVAIMDGNIKFVWKLAILLGVGIVTYFISIKKFQKKDLPL